MQDEISQTIFSEGRLHYQSWNARFPAAPGRDKGARADNSGEFGGSSRKHHKEDCLRSVSRQNKSKTFKFSCKSNRCRCAEDIPLAENSRGRAAASRGRRLLKFQKRISTTGRKVSSFRRARPASCARGACAPLISEKFKSYLIRKLPRGRPGPADTAELPRPIG